MPPFTWRERGNGKDSVCNFEPNPPLPNIRGVRAELVRNEGGHYRWGIKLLLANGQEISLRGDGGYQRDIAADRCEAAFPTIARWAREVDA